MLSKDDAERCLGPYLPTIKTCIDGGWAAWKQHYAAREHVLDARARASIVYCETLALAKAAFDGAEGVRFVKKRGLSLSYIGEVALRFKKLKRNGTCSNVPTQQQRCLQMQIEIPGFLPSTYVNAGYVLDPLQQEIERVLVSCQLADKVIWSIRPGQDGRGTSGGLVTRLPVAPALRPARRVRPRKDKQVKDGETS
jgi:hypothetical protein